MPKLLKNGEELIDLSNINPNKMLSMSFDFEILKYVITSLIHNQQNFDKKLIELNLSLLKQKQYISKLEISIIDQKIENEQSSKEKEKLLREKEELNSKKERYNKDIELLIKKNEENIKKKNIPIYSISKEGNNINNIEPEENNKNIINERDKKDINNKDIINKDIYNKDANNNKNEKKENKIIIKSDYLNTDKEKDNNKDKKNNSNINDNIDNKISNNVNKNDNNKNKKEIETIEKITIVPSPVRGARSSKNNENSNIKEQNELIQKELQIIVGELKNVKIKNQTLEQNFTLFNQNITENIKNKLENGIPSMIESKIDTRILTVEKILDEIKKEINNLRSNYDQKFNELNENILKEIELKEETNNQTLDKIKNNFHVLKENLNITNEKLYNYITKSTFTDLKEGLHQKLEDNKKLINLDLSVLKSSINSLKILLNDHLKDTIDHDNLVEIMSTTDTLTKNMKKLLEFKKVYEEKEKRKTNEESNKYIKQEIYHEEINNIYKMIDNNKKNLLDITGEIKSIKTKDIDIKANLKDLKVLEDKVFEKMEILKDEILDKFVEKTMLVKNLKYLDFQIKKISEDSKRNEKKENWILSKKPLNGHLCACCESYIGDLKQDTSIKYEAWNKYPKRESSNRTFKINAGFSKVLQMIQDNNNEREKNNNLNNSQIKEEKIRTSPEGEKFTKIMDNNEISKTSRENPMNRMKINSNIHGDDSDFVKSLPKISIKKNNNLSLLNFSSEDSNETSIIHSKIGNRNNQDNTGKKLSKTFLKKNRSMAGGLDISNTKNIYIYKNEENKAQITKISKITQKKRNASEKKEDNN